MHRSVELDVLAHSAFAVNVQLRCGRVEGVLCHMYRLICAVALHVSALGGEVRCLHGSDCCRQPLQATRGCAGSYDRFGVRLAPEGGCFAQRSWYARNMLRVAGTKDDTGGGERVRRPC